MSINQSALISMERYEMDFSIDVSLPVLASLISMIGAHVDLGPGKVEDVREDIFAKVVLLKDLVDRHPEMREEEDFYSGYYMTLCVYLLALDAYMEGALINLGQIFELVQPSESDAPSVNPNFDKFFH
jgi:hypothetical protein